MFLTYNRKHFETFLLKEIELCLNIFKFLGIKCNPYILK